MMQIGLACDHGGFELKEELKAFLKSFLTAQTFPPTPDRLLIFANAGIDHFTL